MRRLGKIINISRTGRYIVKCERYPEMLEILYKNALDKRGRRIGRITCITGPTNSPYLIIAPSGKIKMTDEEVYVDERK